MIRKRLILAILLSCQIGLVAQSKLSLCYRIETIPKIENYYQSLDSIISTCLGDDFLARVVASPSFEPEYIMQIELVEKKYYLKVISFDNNLWYAKKVTDLTINECNYDLETQIAERVLYLCKQFIDDRMDSVAIGFTDGDLYQFEVKVDGALSCGQVREPASFCPLGSMCNLCDQIKDLCFMKNKPATILKEELQQQLFKLTTEVQNNSKTNKIENNEDN